MAHGQSGHAFDNGPLFEGVVDDAAEIQIISLLLLMAPPDMPSMTETKSKPTISNTDHGKTLSGAWSNQVSGWQGA